MVRTVAGCHILLHHPRHGYQLAERGIRGVCLLNLMPGAIGEHSAKASAARYFGGLVVGNAPRCIEGSLFGAAQRIRADRAAVAR